MFRKSIFASVLALGAVMAFSEPLKPGRPDAYTRGINPGISCKNTEIVAESSSTPRLKVGRPDAYTRGIHPTPVPGSVGAKATSDSEAKPSRAKTGRPDAYTRGIDPSKGQSEHATSCP